MNLREQSRPAGVRKLQSALERHASAYPHGDPSLWSVQREALQGLHAAVASDRDGGQAYYMDMFTGTGKTHVLIKTIELMAAMEGGRPPQTLVISPTQETTKNFYHEVEKFAPRLLPHVGLYYSFEKNPFHPIVSTTYNSFLAGTRNGTFDPASTMLIALDEVHESLPEARVAARELYKQALHLGLTATPHYSSDRSVDAYFRCAYHLSHERAMEKGVIAPVRNIVLPTDISLDDVDYTALKGYNTAQLEHAVNTHSRNLKALQFYKTRQDEYTGKPLLGQQGIAYCSSINHARDFAALGNKVMKDALPPGTTFCAAVWGSMPDNERRETFKRYENGEILFLSNADLLVRGYNYPKASIGMNLAPSRSSVVVGQRGGRLRRVDPENPEKVSYIIDVVDQAQDPKNYPLLYGEYVGGAAFGHVFSDKPAYSFPPPSTGTTDEEAPALFTPESVDAYLRTRKEEREKAQLRRGVIEDRILPPVRAMMNEAGIETASILYQKIRHLLPAEEALGPDDYKPTFERFHRIITGVTLAWDKRDGSPTHEAMALSDFFISPVEDLFGAPPENLRKRAESYNPDIHRNFLNAMKEAGYRSMAQVMQDIVLYPGQLSQLSNLARGQASIFANGKISPLAEEVATLFNTTPEALFGFDPLKPLTSHRDMLPPAPDADEAADPMETDDCEEENSCMMVSALLKGGSGYEWKLIAYPDEEDEADLDTLLFLPEEMQYALRSVTEREEQVFFLRFWEDLELHETGKKLKNLEGEEIGYSRERIRQIEAKALRKLRHPMISDSLRDFLPGDLTQQENAYRKEWKKSTILATQFFTAVGHKPDSEVQKIRERLYLRIEKASLTGLKDYGLAALIKAEASTGKPGVEFLETWQRIARYHSFRPRALRTVFDSFNQIVEKHGRKAVTASPDCASFLEEKIRETVAEQIANGSSPEDDLAERAKAARRLWNALEL